ncbi:MAG: MFS transporter [Clostridiales bacterium]|nr:MFS transporter [Clostridiales bacterium]
MKENIMKHEENSISYTYTIYACYIGYVVQAIINNLPPLLFLTFQREFGISTERIGLLITINFGMQMITDSMAARFADRIGYRVSVVAAHVCSIAGLICLGILPRVMEEGYVGLVIAMLLNAVGGGLIEVLISPIVEAAPSSDAKAAAMSLLHSFYCWGHVGVVVLSTIGLNVLGMGRWYILPLLWSVIPAVNVILFLRVPINRTVSTEEQMSWRQLFGRKPFWLFFVLMICAGASEQAMSQWASMFAEVGLGVSKTMGDLLGPCLFAVLMGTSRTFYGKCGETINLKGFMAGSGMLCVLSYLLAILMKEPVLALLGCGLCGLSVGIMWPGTFSLAAKYCPQGGTLMYAFFALAGDIGCASGPGVVSVVSGLLPTYGLKAGFAAAMIFPVLLIILLLAGKELREPITFLKKTT